MANNQHQAELHRALWAMATRLRNEIEASELKNYILGLIFYRFLSEKVEETGGDSEHSYEWYWENNAATRSDVTDTLVEALGYAIEPEYLFSKFVNDINEGDFDLDNLQQAINKLNLSIRTNESKNSDSLENLFGSLDLNSANLGKNYTERGDNIGKILTGINGILFSFDDVEIDVLGDAYEYLIGLFSSDAGKSAGEFYTPQQVSRIIAKIVTGNKKKLKSVYDPTCGSGSLLLRVAKETAVDNYYGQEKTPSTYNLARMNMLLHNVSHEDFNIKNDNTLTKPHHLGKKFEAIVANPPYSAQWEPDLVDATDERFRGCAKLAPKTKADFAFVQHMIHHLDDNGTMAVVLPHGVLFRGAAEGAIRKHLLEQNYLDAVIGLPANIFYGTSIPTCILVFKKCRDADAKVLFVDASNEFEKGKNSNSLRDVDVDKIVKAYQSRKEEDKLSREVTLKEIKENDYNLNIPRYVDSSISEDRIDLSQIIERMATVEVKISETDRRITEMMKKLNYINPIEVYSKKLYELILDSAPTLQGVALIYSKNGFDVMTHDGYNVEAHAYESYPVQMETMKEVTSNLLRYLQVETFAILLTKNKKAEIFTHNDLHAAVWTDADDFFKGTGLTDDEKWEIIEQSHDSAYSSQVIKL